MEDHRISLRDRPYIMVIPFIFTCIPVSLPSQRRVLNFHLPRATTFDVQGSTNAKNVCRTLYAGTD